MKRGRPRTNSPAPFPKEKLPDYVYWDPSGRGHWYTVFQISGKRQRRRIAGNDATLSDLHRIMEDKTDSNCLNWLAERFEASPQFARVSKKQKLSYRYARDMVCRHPTIKPDIKLGQVPLDDWRPALVQKLIDSLAEKRGPSAAKKAKEYLNRLFNWSMNRDYINRNPVGKPEMPPERKLQRLPAKPLLAGLVAFAKARGSQAKRKGTCAPYIWIALEVCRKCRFRGVEAFTLADPQLLERGIESRRRKGSKDNVTTWDPGLRAAIDAALVHRAKVRKSVPINPEDRVVIVGTSGQAIKPSTWQSAWKRLMDLAEQEGIITRDQRFGLHDMKRRGVTDYPGSSADKLDASGLSDRRILKVYDKSMPDVGPSPD